MDAFNGIALIDVEVGNFELGLFFAPFCMKHNLDAQGFLSRLHRVVDTDVVFAVQFLAQSVYEVIDGLLVVFLSDEFLRLLPQCFADKGSVNTGEIDAIYDAVIDFDGRLPVVGEQAAGQKQ